MAKAKEKSEMAAPGSKPVATLPQVSTSEKAPDGYFELPWHRLMYEPKYGKAIHGDVLGFAPLGALEIVYYIVKLVEETLAEDQHNEVRVARAGSEVYMRNTAQIARLMSSVSRPEGMTRIHFVPAKQPRKISETDEEWEFEKMTTAPNLIPRT